jgi:hypothetical protein
MSRSLVERQLSRSLQAIQRVRFFPSKEGVLLEFEVMPPSMFAPLALHGVQPQLIIRGELVDSPTYGQLEFLPSGARGLCYTYLFRPSPESRGVLDRHLRFAGLNEYSNIREIQFFHGRLAYPNIFCKAFSELQAP